MGVILKFKRNPKYCQHTNVLVDETKRIVECESCNQIIDPFNYLAQVAKNQESLFFHEDRLRKEAENLIEEISKLKRQRQNLKQAIKRNEKN